MSNPPNDVRIEKLDGEWTVFVFEDSETTQKTFETEQFAKSFADGQRMRLGLSPARRTTTGGEAGIIEGSEL
jgi:hypothetical protein